MKSENGFGSIYKKTGKHNRPWVAVVTIGWKIKDGKARQIRKQIGSFANKNDAREALIQYQKDPVLPDATTCTLEDVFNKWWEGHKSKVTTTNNVTAGWRYLEPLHKRQFSLLRPAHFEDALNEYNYNAQKRAKTVLNHVYRFAMKNELIDKNYASFCEITANNEVKRERRAFTEEEIATIWKHEGELIADMIIIQIYSGWRPAELFDYRIDRINDCMIGGSKTEAGRGRVVPIHSAIRHLAYKYESGFPYTYGWYWEKFKEFTASLGMDHIPHECRHTFATLGKRYGMDEYILKKIIGHSVNDITEKVYTHRTIQELKTEIEKIRIGQLSEEKVVSYVEATLSATNSK